MYKIVKRYYDKGIYTKENVATFVRAGKITAEQYKEITGDTYEEV
jgi:uncharacterized XkdX family phage protein